MSTVNTKSPSREVRSRKAEVVTRRILDAAQAEFMAEGFERANIDSVQKALGGSKATIFRHFPTKRVLFLAVIERIATQWHACVKTDDLSLNDPEAWLIGFCRRVLNWILSDEPMFVGRATISNLASFPEIRTTFRHFAIEPIQFQIAEALRTWMNDGRFGDGDGEVEAMTLAIMDQVVISAVARKLFGNDDLDKPDLLDTFVLVRVRFIIGGLSVR